MSGITRSTPSNSDSGNIIPASTTRMSSPNRNAIMFIPNSPSPPRGITVSDCLLLLNEGFSPQPNSESYHTAPRPALQQHRLQPVFLGSSYLCSGRSSDRPLRCVILRASDEDVRRTSTLTSSTEVMFAD